MGPPPASAFGRAPPPSGARRSWSRSFRGCGAPSIRGQEAKADRAAPEGQLGGEASIQGGQAGGSLKLCFELPLQVALALKHGPTQRSGLRRPALAPPLGDGGSATYTGRGGRKLLKKAGRQMVRGLALQHLKLMKAQGAGSASQIQAFFVAEQHGAWDSPSMGISGAATAP